MEIETRDGFLFAVKTGLDTTIGMYDDRGNKVELDLTWVEAQQLCRWLKERLGE